MLNEHETLGHKIKLKIAAFITVLHFTITVGSITLLKTGRIGSQFTDINKNSSPVDINH